MTKGVSPDQHQIEGCRHERRKRHIRNGVWVPTPFRLLNVWGWRESIIYGIIFIVAGIITSLT